MSKIIKYNESEALPVTNLPPTNYNSQVVKRPVIDRDVFDAKTEAKHILEQAQAQAEDIIAQANAQAQETIAQATQEAAMIMPNAQAQAEQLIANANAESAELKATAEERGYAEGKEAGAAQLIELIAKQTKQFNDFCATLEPQILQLTLSIMRKVISEELEAGSDIVVKITQRALKTVRQRREITIRANPQDILILKENKRALLDVLSRTKDIIFEEDPAIPLGGVLIETEAGRIDARLDTQLDVFEKIFNGTPS